MKLLEETSRAALKLDANYPEFLADFMLVLTIFQKIELHAPSTLYERAILRQFGVAWRLYASILFSI